MGVCPIKQLTGCTEAKLSHVAVEAAWVLVTSSEYKVHDNRETLAAITNMQSETDTMQEL